MTPPGRRFAVCQLGARMQYAVPRMLYEAGALDRVFTDLYTRDPWRWLLRVVPPALLPSAVRLLTSRASSIPDQLVHASQAFGLRYAVKNRWAHDSEALSAIFLWAGREFGRRVVRSGFGAANAVYSFNTAALEILRSARQQGLCTIVEQTIVPRAIEQALIGEEHARHPGWETMPTLETSTQLLADREAEEWSLADLIICGSEFVREGLCRLGGPVERCVVVPYGVTLRPAERGPRRADSRRLRVLIVGHVSLRKGAPYALAAATQLGELAEFRWIGPNLLNAPAATQLARHIELTGALPRSEVLRQYAWADVFLLPSVCEGSATVTYEALASGVPVITTPSAGSMVRDGVDGFIVATGDSEAIVARLLELAGDRGLLSRLAGNAAEGAGRLTFASYTTRLLPHLLSPSAVS